MADLQNLRLRQFPFTLFGLSVGAFLVGSLVLYGVSVYFENQVLVKGRETRILNEENQELRVSLDRIRAYSNVAEVSQKVKKLQDAKNVVEVTRQYGSVPALSLEPAQQLPRTTYGY